MKFLFTLALSLGTLSLSQARPSTVPHDLSQRSFTADNSTINSNNTANCTNCTNLGNFDSPLPVSPSDPVVHLSNGTYAGITIPPISPSATLSNFGTNTTQEAFLGIPYSQQPVGSLRFSRPQSLNSTWSDIRSAARYSEQCFGVGTDDDYNPPYVTYKLGEKCLTLNVVRPAGVGEGKGLPVWVWIHGGGFSYGGSADRRYNGSFIVDRSVAIEEPVIFVSLNYRVNLLGFPVGSEAESEGIQNLGLYDQRLALRWIKENIESFGGDPEKVTIVGESAGGASVFFHLAAYGGVDEGLFRGAVVESGYWGSQLPTKNKTKSWDQSWNSLAKYAGCGGSNSTLDCLRRVPLETIKTWSMENNATLSIFNPVVDVDLVPLDLQQSFLENKFVKDIPVLLNANMDEGISFGVRGVNSSSDITAALDASNDLPDNWSTPSATSDLFSVYPDNEDIYPPYQAGAGLLPGTPYLGFQDRRSCAIFGDLIMIGPRRQAAEQLARASNASIYVSRFDQLAYKQLITGGAQHFQEVAFVFRNPLDTQNALGPGERDIGLANEMSSYWISFVATGDPNCARNKGKAGEGASGVYWPKYTVEGRGSVAWVRNGKGDKSFELPDTYRREGMELLMDLRSGQYKGRGRAKDEL